MPDLEPSRHAASGAASPPSKPPTPDPGAWAEGFPGLVLHLDDQGAVVYANRPISGLDPREAVGVDFLHFVPPAAQAVAAAAIQDAAHLDLAHTLDLPIVGPGGQGTTHHLGTASPIRLASGAHGVLITALDINNREREAERLRQSERLLVDTEGITHIGTWYWDITQPNAQWSAELFHIYGLDAKTHVPTYQDYLTRIHPDDVERVKAATEAVFKDRKPYSHDERIRHTDGTWRWLHTWARAIENPPGTLVALAGVCQDITDRKLAEATARETQARFHTLFERSAFGVAILDSQGQILEANAALRTLCGMPQDDLMRRAFASLLEPESAALCRAGLDELSSGDASGRQLDVVMRRPGVPSVGVRVTLAVVRGPPDIAPFTVALVEDRSLAQRALAADQLAMSRLEELKQVEEANERHRQLLHVASHELKNPLTPVRMQLHMLEQGLLGSLNERQAKAVAVSSKQIRRITRLLQDVLDVARIEQGQLGVKLERMDAGAAVRRVHETFHEVAAQWGVALDQSAEAGLWVDADPDRLEQVLVNLVSNALKFTPQGGLVRIVGRRIQQHVVLEVIDSGAGMDPAQQARLFKAFSQVHAAGAGREGGTGLGLYIARNLVTAMRGTIAVASEPGHGATFAVALPATPAPVALPAGAPAS